MLEDGNRIDIGVETLAHIQKGCTRNKLFLPLYDKTGCLPKLPAPSDEDYYVKPPVQKQFEGCYNEFFWSLGDVLKGIARDEISFAITTYHTISPYAEMVHWLRYEIFRIILYKQKPLGIPRGSIIAYFLLDDFYFRSLL